MIDSGTSDLMKAYEKVLLGFNKLIDNLYSSFIANIKIFIIISLVISISFSIIKTLFFYGYNVDSYQIFALSLEKWIQTGIQDDLFNQYYARNRLTYPLVIAIVHIFFPIDISILACLINLLFGLLTLYSMRKLLEVYDYSEEEKDIFSLFSVLSYTFLNYWFNIITDLAGLFFFILMIYYLEVFLVSKDKSKSTRLTYLILSGISLFFAVLSREMYVLAIILYFVLIKNRIARLIIILLVFWIGFLIIDQNPANFPLFKHFFPPSYWEEFINKNYGDLFSSLLLKWNNSLYTQDFIKGLIKVGIIPVFIIMILILIKIIIEIINDFIKEQNGIKQRIMSYSHHIFTPRITIVSTWFFIFFIVYTVFYSNIYSASGLRYWLPISWIPLAYVTRAITKRVESKHIRVCVILFLCTFPLAWSSIELYFNRNIVSGTGPIFKQNLYFNDMTDLRTIKQYYPQFVNVTVENGSYFKTVSLEKAYEKDDQAYRRSYIAFHTWLNITSNMTLSVRLLTPNDAYWGFTLYEVRPDFSSGYGAIMYNLEELEASSDFQVYEFQIRRSFLLRRVTLRVGGGPGSTVLWDCINITVC